MKILVHQTPEKYRHLGLWVASIGGAPQARQYGESFDEALRKLLVTFGKEHGIHLNPINEMYGDPRRTHMKECKKCKDKYPDEAEFYGLGDICEACMAAKLPKACWIWRVWGIRHIRWLTHVWFFNRHLRECQSLGLGFFAQPSDLLQLRRIRRGDA